MGKNEKKLGCWKVPLFTEFENRNTCSTKKNYQMLIHVHDDIVYVACWKLVKINTIEYYHI